MDQFTDQGPIIEDNPAFADQAPKVAAPGGGPVIENRRAPAATGPTLENNPIFTPKPTVAMASHTHSPTPDDEPELSLAESGRQALGNAPRSIGNAIMGTAHALNPMNWGETAGTLGSLGKGAVSQVAGALGAQQAPDEKAKNEALINALEKHYGQTYGSWKGFKKGFAEDPASIGMDFSTILGGAGGLARVGGLAKTARALSKAATVTDPVQSALYLARQPLKAAAAINRGAQAVSSGVPYELLGTIADAAMNGTPAQRAAYKLYHGGEDVGGIADAMKTAVKKKEAAEWNAVRQTRAGLYAAKPGSMAPHLNDVDNTLSKVEQEMASKQTPTNSYFPTTQAAVEHMRGLVDKWKADPNLQNLEGFNDLREGIGEYFGTNSHTNKQVKKVYDSVLEGIGQVSPEFRDSLAHASELHANIKELKTALGAGDKHTVTQTAKKLVTAMRERTGRGQTLLRTIADVDPTIPHMLAGHLTKDWNPAGLRNIVEAAGLSSIPTAAAVLQPHMWGPLALGAAGTLASASPKLAGKMQYWGGRGANLAGKLTSQPVTKSGYYANRAQEEPGIQSAGLQAAALPGATDIPQAAALHGGDFRNQRTNNMGMIEDGDYARHQPGYIGSDGRFAKFSTPEAGIAASRKLVQHKLSTGLNTPEKLVENWAPATENPPAARAAYKRRIADAVGIGINDPIPPEAVDAVLHAMATSEGAPLQRARGGRTGIDHEAEAASMVRRAETIKKGLGKTTEPLLNKSDDHIAQALSVANEAI